MAVRLVLLWSQAVDFLKKKAGKGKKTTIQTPTRHQLLSFDRDLIARYHYSDEPLSPKALKLLGDERLFPLKAQKVIGVYQESRRLPSAENARLLREQEEKLMKEIERNQRKLRQQKTKFLDSYLKKEKGPTAQQRAVPNDRFVSEKALKVLGDDMLTQSNLKVVTKEMRKNVKPKTLEFFGDSDLLTKKERQILGSFDNNHSYQTERRLRKGNSVKQHSGFLSLKY